MLYAKNIEDIDDKTHLVEAIGSELLRLQEIGIAVYGSTKKCHIQFVE